MENQDKEFETFLRQFQLRQPAPWPKTMPTKPRRAGLPWALAAAAVVLVLLSLAFIWNLRGIDHPHGTVEAAGGSQYTTGERIEVGNLVSSGNGESLVLILEDESRIEARAQSELLLESVGNRVHVRLNRGGVLVSVMKRPAEQLYVQTSDARISVAGTLFVVEKETAGTRVGVLEGKVEVEALERGTSIRLSAGEQTATSPAMGVVPLAEMIGWSRRASEFAALLQPSAGPSVQADMTSPSKPSGVQPAPEPPPEEKALPAMIQSIRGSRSAAGPRQGQQPEAPAQPPRQPETQPREQPQSDAGPEGPGRQIFARACGACHNLQIAGTMYATRDDYATLVSREVSKGAGVSGSEVSILVDYLFATFGQKRK